MLWCVDATSGVQQLCGMITDSQHLYVDSRGMIGRRPETPKNQDHETWIESKDVETQRRWRTETSKGSTLYKTEPILQVVSRDHDHDSCVV